MFSTRTRSATAGRNSTEGPHMIHTPNSAPVEPKAATTSANTSAPTRKTLSVMHRMFWLIVQTLLWLVVALAAASRLGMDTKNTGVVVAAGILAFAVAWLGTSAIGRGADQG